jgi:flavin reductase
MEFSQNVSMQLFRDGMARLGASVNIVTSYGPSGRVGFTATSVCSVSDSPPSLLVCMNRSSQQNVPLQANGVLCVNVLAAEHREISAAFAGVGKLDIERRFELGAWTSLKTGSPVLGGALASFDCEIRQSIEVNTHTVIICEVVDVSLMENEGSLMYFNREYHQLSRLS